MFPLTPITYLKQLTIIILHINIMVFLIMIMIKNQTKHFFIRTMMSNLMQFIILFSLYAALAPLQITNCLPVYPKRTQTNDDSRVQWSGGNFTIKSRGCNLSVRFVSLLKPSANVLVPTFLTFDCVASTRPQLI